MSDIIYLIHGFNVKDGGTETTDSIKLLLEDLGYVVRELDYGYFHRIRVRLCNKGIAKMIANLIKPGSTCIAHSNGGAIVYEACKFGAQFDNVILVNPALDSELSLPDQVKRIQVWYSPTDKWTKVAKYIPKSAWGSQGRTGYTGPEDSRYVQFNEDEIFKRKTDHSGIWHSHKSRKYLVDQIDKMIKGT